MTTVPAREFDAVLFDWCGTLVAYPTLEERLRLALEQVGRHADQVTVGAHAAAIRGTDRDPALAVLEAGCDLSAENHRHAKLTRFDRAGLDAQLAGALEATYGDLSTYQPYPEVPAVISHLTGAGVEVVVVSDFHVDLRPHFESIGVLPQISGFALSCEVGAVKPASAMFEAALDHVHADPARCLMVGDNPGPDAGAAFLGITSLILPFLRSGRPPLLDRVTRLVLGAHDPSSG